jgi:hypothetical protein
MVWFLVTGDTGADRGENHLMLRSLAISTVLFVGAVSVANADVFRWVDEHGGVHYSDQWVPGSEVIKSSKPRPPSSSTASADTPRRSAEAQKSTNAPPSADANTAKAMKQDLAKAREQQCKDAKEKYEKAIEARRIYKGPAPSDSKSKGGGDGTEDRQYLSDEEADAYRLRMRQEMQDLCGSSAK